MLSQPESSSDVPGGNQDQSILLTINGQSGRSLARLIPKTGQGIVRDERGQEQPADKRKAQQTSSRRQHGQDDPPLDKADAPRAFRTANRPERKQESSNG
jgi:hypothetical protein